MKIKKSIVFVAMTLVLVFSCGCFVSYAESSSVLEQEKTAMAQTWAESLKSRDGKPRYEMMSEKCKAAFVEEQSILLGDNWNYVIGWSSPWVVSYEVDVNADAAVITYEMKDNTPYIYYMKERIKFGKENGNLVVEEHFYSNVYGEDILPKVKVIVDNEELYPDVSPVIIDDITMLPVRAVFEAMGAEVQWNAETSTAAVVKEGVCAELTMENKYINAKGNSIEMELAPVVIDNRMLIPAKYVGEVFSADVYWHEDMRTISIKTK